jgi:hypothetical protein
MKEIIPRNKTYGRFYLNFKYSEGFLNGKKKKILKLLLPYWTRF